MLIYSSIVAVISPTTSGKQYKEQQSTWKGS